MENTSHGSAKEAGARAVKDSIEMVVMTTKMSENLAVHGVNLSRGLKTWSM